MRNLQRVSQEVKVFKKLARKRWRDFNVDSEAISSGLKDFLLLLFFFFRGKQLIQKEQSTCKHVSFVYEQESYSDKPHALVMCKLRMKQTVNDDHLENLNCQESRYSTVLVEVSHVMNFHAGLHHINTIFCWYCINW